MDRARLMEAAPRSMFIMKSADYVHAQEALEDAVRLAKRSHARHGVTSEEFERSFLEFVKRRLSWGPGRAAVLQHKRRQREREREEARWRRIIRAEESAVETLTMDEYVRDIRVSDRRTGT